MKKNILILISTTLLSACMPQVYNKTQISPRVVNVLELWSLDILFDDIFQILRNDSVITDELNFNDINFILKNIVTRTSLNIDRMFLSDKILSVLS